MNRAQKVAWMNMVGGLISVILLGLLGCFLLLGPTSAKLSLLRYAAILFACVMVLFFVIFFALVLRKKQSSMEPDADERDRLISKKAIQVAFVAVCLLMFFATVLPMWIYGLDSSIPTVALPLINMAVFTITLAIYNAAILILYKFKGGAT